LIHSQARQAEQHPLQVPHRQRVVDRHLVKLRGPGPEIWQESVAAAGPRLSISIRAAEVRFLLAQFKEGIIWVVGPEPIHIVVVQITPPGALGCL
jgi:hypothetical protein